MTADVPTPKGLLTPQEAEVFRNVYLYYRLYDLGGALLYVGISADLRKRQKAHRYQTPWFFEVASHRIQGPFTWRGAYKAEAEAIIAEFPRYNTCIDPAEHARASKIPDAPHDKCCVGPVRASRSGVAA